MTKQEARKQLAFFVWEWIGNLAVLYMYGCIVFGYSVEAFKWFIHYVNNN